MKLSNTQYFTCITVIIVATFVAAFLEKKLHEAAGATDSIDSPKVSYTIGSLILLLFSVSYILY